MNGIEKITGRITADARREIEALDAETSAKCAEITESYKKTAADEYARIIAKGESDAALRLERMNSIAQLDAKKQVLAEKQALVGEAFARAVSMLRELPDDNYVALLAKLALKASFTGEEEIILSADDRAKFGARVCDAANEALRASGKNAALTLSEKTRSIPGGLILVNGKLEVNCSLDVLVDSCKNELTGEVAKILFD